MSDNESMRPANDIVFQAIFGKQKNKNITQDFLSCILKRKVVNINLDLNRQMIGDYLDSKSSRLDVRATFNDGEECNIEMQLSLRTDMDKRLLDYWASMYNDKIKAGNKYSVLKPTISILITGYNVPKLAHIPKYHTKWNLREEYYPNTILTEDIEFHVLELPKIKKSQINNDRLALWLEFVQNPDGEEVNKNMDKEENKYLKQAKKEFEYLKGDPAFKRLVEAREGFLRDQDSAESEKFDAGLEKGKKIRSCKRTR